MNETKTQRIYNLEKQINDLDCDRKNIKLERDFLRKDRRNLLDALQEIQSQFVEIRIKYETEEIPF
jgi:hypothetical protein